MTVATRPDVTAEPGQPLAVRDPLVRIDGLVKRFAVRRSWREIVRAPRDWRSAYALQGVSCEIGRGELFGLLGPNGAGKSTLFRVLCTLVTPDEGTATVAGFDVRRDAARVREVAALVTVDERSLNWRISARENLRFYAALLRLRGPEAARRIDRALEIVDLARTRDQLVGTFSSGMKQRLLIARALLSRPQVLLLDEPTRSLDPIAGRRFRRLLREEIAERAGCTVLLATHNADEALDICDRVGILHEGRLVALAPPRALSRLLGNERYQVYTSTPAHPLFEALARDGSIEGPTHLPGDEGWSVVEFGVPGNDEHAPTVLATLTGGGVRVARFQKVQPALADVIEGVVSRDRAQRDLARRAERVERADA